MSGRSDDMRDGIVRAALGLCLERPWTQVRVQDIACSADVDLGVIYEMGGKPAILAHMDGFFDRAMGRGVAALHEGASEAEIREQLCEVMMQRFDAMERYRPALTHVYAYLKAHPAQRALAAVRRLETARWAIAVSGVDEAAMGLKALGLAASFARATDIWLRDVSPNELTLAAIDKDLRRYGDWARDAARVGGWVKAAFSSSGRGRTHDAWEPAEKTGAEEAGAREAGPAPLSGRSHQSARGRNEDNDTDLSPPPPPL